jgi:TolB-like protein
MSFVKELKRRNVFKVGAAYLAVAWLIAQVSELALGSFGAPDWIIRTELFLLAVGFPVALVLAWAFELTPEGIKREVGVASSESEPFVRGRTLDYVIIASLALALGYFVWERQHLTQTTETHDRSIAVLPFVDRSADTEQEWFADGLTEEIINSLTRTPDLRVASSTSSFAFKDSNEDIRTISKSLGVAHILEGSVRRSLETLRVTVQLSRASDGFNLWAETYNRPNADVIAIQEEIAIEIAKALETTIDPEALAAMVSAGTHSVSAYEAYLKGLAIRVNAGNTALDREADEAFALAVTIDPEFSTAHYQRAFIRVGQLYGVSTEHGRSELTIDEIEEQFYDSIDQAIQHEDDVVVKTRYRARRAWIDMKFRQALQLYSEYLELRPGDEDAMVDRFIVLRSLGMRDQAVNLALEFVKNGVKLNRATGQALRSMFQAGDSDEIVAYARKIVGAAPDNIYLSYQAHTAFLWAMDVDAARAVLPGILFAPAFSESNKPLAQLRQACAEERESDARQYHTEIIERSDRLVINWLAHKIIGDNSKAESVLREYDERGNFHNLAGLLQYGPFDPTILPNFMARLAGQDIEEREVIEFPFRCNRLKP